MVQRSDMTVCKCLRQIQAYSAKKVYDDEILFKFQMQNIKTLVTSLLIHITISKLQISQ